MIDEKNHSAKSLETGIGLSLWINGLKKTLRAYFYLIKRAIYTQEKDARKSKSNYRNKFCKIRLFILNCKLEFI